MAQQVLLLAIRIRGQTFSDSWVEQNLFFSVLAARRKLSEYDEAQWLGILL